jgi:methionyl-tRNA formyltransferase
MTRVRLSLPTELDWALPTHRLQSLVRAYGPPGPGAWTTWRDMQLFVADATIVDAAAAPVGPGTVLEATSAGVLVATADGVMLLDQPRDIVGPVAPTRIEAGEVLGGSARVDVARLRQRVQDLEYVIRRLTEGVDLR